MRARPILWLPALFALCGAGVVVAWALRSSEPEAADVLDTGVAAEPAPLEGASRRALLHLNRRVGWIEERRVPVADGARLESRTSLRVRRKGRVAVTTRSLVAEVDRGGALRSATLRARPLEIEATLEKDAVSLRVRLHGETRAHRLPLAAHAGAVHVEPSLRAWVSSRDRPWSGPIELLDLEQARLHPVTATWTPTSASSGELSFEDGFGVRWSERVDGGEIVFADSPIPGVTSRRFEVGEAQAAASEVDVALFGELLVSGRLPAPGAPLRLRLRGLPPRYPRDGLDARAETDGTFVADLSMEPPRDPSAAEDGRTAAARAPSPFVESDAPEIRTTARDLRLAGLERAAALEAVVRWLQREIRIADAVGPPSALATLRARKGNCNELASLGVALLRAAGFAARLAFGVARVGPGFRYHAWGELRDDGRWRAFDPTLGVVEPRATHLRLSAGGVEAQGAVLAAAGRLTLHVETP